MFLTEGEVLMG